MIERTSRMKIPALLLLACGLPCSADVTYKYTGVNSAFTVVFNYPTLLPENQTFFGVGGFTISDGTRTAPTPDDIANGGGGIDWVDTDQNGAIYAWDFQAGYEPFRQSSDSRALSSFHNSNCSFEDGFCGDYVVTTVLDDNGDLLFQFASGSPSGSWAVTPEPGFYPVGGLILAGMWLTTLYRKRAWKSSTANNDGNWS